MRRVVIISVGALLFTVGLCAGFLVCQHGIFDRHGAPGGLADPKAAEEPSVTHKRKSSPTREADQQSLRGLWVLERKPGSSPKILLIADGYLNIRDFGDDISYAATSGLGIRLEERDGQRLILYSDEGVVLFRYRLEGDTLELEDRPMDRPAGWELDHPRRWVLTGKWLLLKPSKDA
ncbi:MAG: hypothetical protein HY289_13110 [Planctomycetes bacterium]|nr:hypothetical protein [Planctomycetota bacterium]